MIFFSKLIIKICTILKIKNYIPDKIYLHLMYYILTNKKLNLDNPKTFNEKLQWLKLHNRKPEYTKMVDKYEVKNYITNILGKEYIIPTLGVYEKWEDINLDILPNQFVIKCTHDSGGIAIVRDKNSFDFNKAKKKIKRSLKNNYYWNCREWPYKNVKPRIIIEKYMEDKFYHELIDYKIYAFDGKCDYVMACFDRFKDNVKFIYFDRNWNMKKTFSNDGMKYGDNINLKRPNNLDLMFKYAEKLSKNIPFVRVDFYEVNGKLYFGEFTFFPSGGFDKNRTKQISKYLDESLDISISKE